jgi:hypothetical protein
VSSSLFSSRLPHTSNSLHRHQPQSTSAPPPNLHRTTNTPPHLNPRPLSLQHPLRNNQATKGHSRQYTLLKYPNTLRPRLLLPLAQRHSLAAHCLFRADVTVQPDPSDHFRHHQHNHLPISFERRKLRGIPQIFTEQEQYWSLFYKVAVLIEVLPFRLARLIKVSDSRLLLHYCLSLPPTHDQSSMSAAVTQRQSVSPVQTKRAPSAGPNKSDVKSEGTVPVQGSY